MPTLTLSCSYRDGCGTVGWARMLQTSQVHITQPSGLGIRYYHNFYDSKQFLYDAPTHTTELLHNDSISGHQEHSIMTI